MNPHIAVLALALTALVCTVALQILRSSHLVPSHLREWALAFHVRPRYGRRISTSRSRLAAFNATSSQPGNRTSKTHRWISVRLVLLSFALLILGGVLVLIRLPDGAGQLMTSLGMALILAGVVIPCLQLVIRRSSEDDGFESMRESMVDTLDTMFLQHASGAATGIQLIKEKREEYEGYYHWATSTAPQTLLFAGRSVLHRIDVELESRGQPRVEQVLLRKLQQGCTIRILFVDPSSDIVSRLAAEEGSRPELMLSNLAVSVGTCNRLYQLVAKAPMPPSARLDIRVYDEAPYFAYHREDGLVILGFYFRGFLGGDTPAFRVMDARTQMFFERHLDLISSGARRLLSVDPPSHPPYFDEHLYEEVRAGLAKYLTPKQLQELLAGRVG